MEYQKTRCSICNSTSCAEVSDENSPFYTGGYVWDSDLFGYVCGECQDEHEEMMSLWDQEDEDGLIGNDD